MAKKVFISTGELSGDIHAANMLKNLLKITDDIEPYAIGGDRLAEAGANLLFHIKDISVMGFWEVAKKYRQIKEVWRKTREFLLNTRPKLVILVDYPGFNLKLAKFCSKNGIPAVYYIAPQIWAWGNRRVKTIRETVREVICIFPFEVEWYKSHGVKATYAGHPIFDQIDISTSKQTKRGHLNGFSIGLLPGSRNQEVRYHLPIMISALRLLLTWNFDVRASIAVAPNIKPEVWEPFLEEPWVNVIKNNSHEVIKNSDLVVVSSGTATLETTIFAKPMVVCYRLSLLSYILGRALTRVRYIAIPNLLSGSKVVPELIQYRFTSENLAREISRYIENIAYREAVSRKLKNIASTLYIKSPGEEAAKIISKYLLNEIRKAK